MEGKDKLIIESKGKRFEIPIHLVKIELHKAWGSNTTPPELVIRAIGMNKEEIENWVKSYAEICWGINE